MPDLPKPTTWIITPPRTFDDVADLANDQAKANGWAVKVERVIVDGQEAALVIFSEKAAVPEAAGGAPGGAVTLHGVPAATPLPTKSTFVGFDASHDCGKFIGKIRSAKMDFVIRYYSHSAWKNLTASEAQLLSHAGILLVSIWESQGKPVSFFSRAQGVDDATTAYNMALQVGQPEGTPIYFAVDCDPLQNDLNKTIIPYFQGVTAGFGTIGHGNSAYTAGVYGSGLVCGTLAQLGLVTHTWLANATGWQRSKTYQDWHIKQRLPSDPFGFGFSIDLDDAKPSFGGFSVIPSVA